PAFQEASLLEDKELLQAVTALNKQIQELAPVLNSPSILKAVEVRSGVPDVPIASMVKQHAGVSYVFAVNMRNQPARGLFRIQGSADAASVEVLQESRALAAHEGEFADEFLAYGVHLYRVPNRKPP